jgi:hypothetical protein
MPPKVPPPPSGPPKPAHPLPPALPVSSNAALVQPRPFERKGEPDGDGGYSSEGNDPPADYYHGMWRTHDRSRNPDAKERKKQRDMVIGWNRNERLDRQEGAIYIRSEEHVFQQAGPYCFAHCAVFAAMRRREFAPAQIISMMKRPSMAAQIQEWQKNYITRYVVFEAQEANEITDVFSCVENEMGPVLASEFPSKWQADAKAVAKPGAKPEHSPMIAPSANIVFPQLIGHYPSITPYSAAHKTSFSVDYSWGGNSVENQSRLPSTVGATSFHQALFANFQAPRKFTVPHSVLKTKRMMTREPTSLVLLDIGCRDRKNATSGHVILADFTDPGHPGLFDPNGGCIEPKQGFCYLDFEQTMQSVWEHYTSNNLQNLQQGLQQLKVAQHDRKIYILVYQLYVQSI